MNLTALQINNTHIIVENNIWLDTVTTKVKISVHKCHAVVILFLRGLALLLFNKYTRVEQISKHITNNDS